METIRTFIAIELTDALQRALADTQARFQRDHAARGVRWVAPENIHITLKFLGDVDAAQMPALQRAIADACAGFAPFTLTIGGAGAFPNTRRPNVVWLGARGQIEIAAQLAQKIDAACATLGFARDERPFTPHLTLGRVKRDASPNERQLIGALIEQTQIGDLGELRVERVSVMKSELKPGGSVYTRLADIQLTTDG
ncbi:MAG: RNA 2',3'-cyclic phosphodiesterase [Anaerolineales bacterium]|nr:RNA 2',3'-cyclic phosphodiesterase [Anaerolineales bacterium]